MTDTDIPDTTPPTGLAPMPAQVDYRADPSYRDPGRQESGYDYRQNPAAGGAFTAPQPQVGHNGYTINQLDSVPNKMVPEPDNVVNLVPGNTPDDPTGIGAWDFWETS